MSNDFYKHIVWISLFCYLNTFSLSTTLTKKDSLRIDTNSSIKKRHFNDLNSIYTGEDFIYDRTINESTGWWTRFKEWLNHALNDLFNLKNDGQASQLTDVLINIAGCIIFILVIYFIFKAVINKEGAWVFGKSSDKSIIPVTNIENNIHQTNFKILIQEAENNTNYRLAIRYYYLWLLKSLTQAELIEYDVEKTNSDYQNEIASVTVKKDFAYTSYLYNYIWYGEFNVNTQEFNKAKHAFINFLNTLKA